MSRTTMHPEQMASSVRGKPRSWDRFERRSPPIAEAYDTLSEICRSAGPLDERMVALAKLAVSVGAASDRTVHIHTKKALRTGIAPDALRQVALIALPTVGLPRALDALQWIEESIDEMAG
jgi:alkylhydroperoxidase/carboxymuconolactone decarboxylase family protein YurZ